MPGLDPTTRLAISELVIYILLVPLVIYILIRHGKPGFLGWSFLLVFCGLRLAADGCQISNHNKEAKGEAVSDTGAILNSIGISALLLALAGVLHESYHRVPDHDSKISLILQLIFHILTTGGIALAAVGGSKLSQPDSSTNKHSTDNALREVGALMLLLVANLLCGYTYFTWRRLRHSRPQKHTNAMLLLYFVTPAALFAIVRAVYTVVYSFDRSPRVSPWTGTFAVKFVLIFLVQLIAALCLVVGGVVTRFICDEDRELVAQQGGRAVTSGDAYTLENYSQGEEHRHKARGVV